MRDYERNEKKNSNKRIEGSSSYVCISYKIKCEWTAVFCIFEYFFYTKTLIQTHIKPVNFVCVRVYVCSTCE